MTISINDENQKSIERFMNQLQETEEFMLGAFITGESVLKHVILECLRKEIEKKQEFLSHLESLSAP